MRSLYNTNYNYITRVSYRWHKHAMSDCPNRTSDGVNRTKILTYKEETRRKWAPIRARISGPLEQLNPSRVFDGLMNELYQFGCETRDLLTTASRRIGESDG